MVDVILTGNYIPTELENKESLEKFDSSRLKGIFSDVTKQPENYRSIKTADPDIKNNSWEEVKGSSNFVKTDDMRSIRPARSEKEHNYGGTGILTKLEGNKQKNNKFTQHILNAGDKKRKETESKKHCSEESRKEWEIVSGTKKMSDVKGKTFGTARTAFEVPDLKKVKIPEIDKRIENNKKSLEAGIEAAKIKKNLDKIMAQKTQETFQKENWEEQEIDRIKKVMSEPLKISKESTQLAEEFTPMAKSEVKSDLSGLFKIPKNPNDIKESVIKRNTNNLMKTRKTRSDDRSWETMSNAKSKKMQK